MDSAPLDGTWVDLWGTSTKDPDKASGIMLPCQWARHPYCAWGAPLYRHGSGLVMPMDLGWYHPAVGSESTIYVRVWPTNWMPVPAGPTELRLDYIAGQIQGKEFEASLCPLFPQAFDTISGHTVTISKKGRRDG